MAHRWVLGPVRLGFASNIHSLGQYVDEPRAHAILGKSRAKLPPVPRASLNRKRGAPSHRADFFFVTPFRLGRAADIMLTAIFPPSKAGNRRVRVGRSYRRRGSAIAQTLGRPRVAEDAAEPGQGEQ